LGKNASVTRRREFVIIHETSAGAKHMIKHTDHEVAAFNVDQAIRCSGLGRTTIYAALKTGALPSLKIGRARRIMRSDLLRYLESFRVAAE
jgi:excisionase family DNA binding protein